MAHGPPIRTGARPRVTHRRTAVLLTLWALVVAGAAVAIAHSPWILWAGFALVGLIAVALVERLFRRREELAELNDRLDRLANVDPLTGLDNRRRTEDELGRAVATARRHGHPLTLLLIDADSFKQVNDVYGHAAGDALLRAVATALERSTRESDLLGRWGGDEFIALLPHTDRDAAQILAARLVEAVRGARVEFEGAWLQASVSIGGAEWERQAPEGLLARADQALHRAKRDGRDRAVIAPRAASRTPADALGELAPNGSG